MNGRLNDQVVLPTDDVGHSNMTATGEHFLPMHRWLRVLEHRFKKAFITTQTLIDWGALWNAYAMGSNLVWGCTAPVVHDLLHHMIPVILYAIIFDACVLKMPNKAHVTSLKEWRWYMTCLTSSTASRCWEVPVQSLHQLPRTIPYFVVKINGCSAMEPPSLLFRERCMMIPIQNRGKLTTLGQWSM